MMITVWNLSTLDESNKDRSDDNLIFERHLDEGVEDILDEDSGKI